jgi:predicted nucleotidyltransferase
MGGAGGFFGGRRSPEELFNKVRDSESKTRDEKFEISVESYIGSLLTKYNQRSENVKTHLDNIKKALEKEIEGSVELIFGGSVAKHTYVDGISDIDALVLLNKSELKDESPEKVKDYFLNRLSERLPKDTPIEKGNLAITITYSDVEVQLLPAIRYKGGYRIADPSGKGWSFIKPQEFAQRLTDMNQNTGGKLIPTIKMAKSINDCQAENRRLKSYHIEALAFEIFKDYQGPKTPKDMLTHFFNTAPEYVQSPLVDVTGQSTHVDSYLGNVGSLERKLVADTLARIGRRMQNANRAHSETQWKEILGGL